MNRWLEAHLRAARLGVSRTYGNILSTAMTVVVVAISLALPACLYILTQNLDGLVAGRDDGRQISVFVDQALDESAALDLLLELEMRPEVHRVELISRDAALEDLKEMSGLGGITEMLDTNPLPVTILVEPGEGYATPQALQAFALELKAMPNVQEIRVDIVWLKRLDAMIGLARRAMWVAAALLGLAVLLTIGNTIRLIVSNHAQEIEITNRIGGTNGFIRRPFLYRGVLLGVLGALLALGLVTLVQVLIEPRVRQLAEAYDYPHNIQGLGGEGALVLLLVGVILGLLASWFAVRRHLRGLRPGDQIVSL